MGFNMISKWYKEGKGMIPRELIWHLLVNVSVHDHQEYKLLKEVGSCYQTIKLFL